MLKNDRRNQLTQVLDALLMGPPHCHVGTGAVQLCTPRHGLRLRGTTSPPSPEA